RASGAAAPRRAPRRARRPGARRARRGGGARRRGRRSATRRRGTRSAPPVSPRAARRAPTRARRLGCGRALRYHPVLADDPGYPAHRARPDPSLRHLPGARLPRRRLGGGAGVRAQGVRPRARVVGRGMGGRRRPRGRAPLDRARRLARVRTRAVDLPRHRRRPRALRRGALPGRVRAREPAHRLRAHRGAAREPHPGRDRRVVAHLEAGVAGGRGLRILLVTGALGLAVAGGLLALARRGPTLAPDFVVPDLAGRTVRLSGLRGKVVVLNLWATWCAPCIEEMPSMERLYAELREADFALLAVSQDEDGKRVVAPFVERMHLSFPVLLDPERQVGDRYGVTGYPETFVIDRNGYVVEHVIGPRDWAAPGEIAALQALIAAGDPGGAPPAPRAP